MSKRARYIGLVVFHNDLNNERFLTEVFRQSLGYHYTQAANCAHMIFNSGEYLVKTFKASEQEKARAILNVFHEHDVPAKLIPL